MKQETKAKLKKAAKEADVVTDKLLLAASQSMYTWAFLAASHLAAFVLGAWFF